MGSSFCDPTREVCPFGAAIDPTLALVNNVYTRTAPPPAVPGITGPIKTEVTVPFDRNAPLVIMNGGFDWRSLIPQIPPITIGGGGGSLTPFSQPRQQPPLLPGRIPPAPLAFPTGQACRSCGKQPCGQAVDSSGCCPKGCHPDKKYGVKCVRNRRMNALNPRALRRALRRVDQFENFVNKTAKLTGLRLQKKSTRRK